MLIIGDFCVLDWKSNVLPATISRAIIKAKEENTRDPIIRGRI